MGRYGGGIWEIEARYSGGHEDLELAPLGVELLDVDLALHAVGRAVEARVRDAALVEEDLDDVEHRGPPAQG